MEKEYLSDRSRTWTGSDRFHPTDAKLDEAPSPCTGIDLKEVCVNPIFFREMLRCAHHDDLAEGSHEFTKGATSDDAVSEETLRMGLVRVASAAHDNLAVRFNPSGVSQD